MVMTRREALLTAVLGSAGIANPARAAASAVPTTIEAWQERAIAHFRATGQWPVFGVAPEVMFGYIKVLVTDRRFVNIRTTTLGRGLYCDFCALIPQRNLAITDIVTLGNLAEIE